MNGIVIFALMFVAPAGADLPAPRATGPWTINGGDNRCFATRNFNINGDDVALGLEPSPTGSGTSFFLLKKHALKTLDVQEAKVGIGAGVPTTARWVGAPVPGVRDFSKYTLSLDRNEYRELIRTGLLSIDGKDGRARYALSGLASVDRKLSECGVLLLASWGLSERDQQRIAQFPKVSTSGLRDKDYPDRAVERGAVGSTELLLTISPEGVPIDCRPIRATGHKDLDQKTCEVLRKKGRFTPAVDRAGQPMQSPIVFSVAWRVQ